MDKLTRKNPDGSFRIPMMNGISLRIENQQDMSVLFGTIADKLGAYEALGTPEEISRILAKK